MTDDRVRALVAAIADGTTATAKELQGLTRSEIDEIERDQSAPLGRSYRQFLELVGAGAGRFLQGSDVFYPSVLGLGPAARILLDENQIEFTLTDEDRVILMHQGYQFDFLRGFGPDPEVWSFSEGTTVAEPMVSFPRFTEWLAAQVEQQTQAWAQLVPRHEAEKAKPPGQRRILFDRSDSDGSTTEQFLGSPPVANRPAKAPTNGHS